MHQLCYECVHELQELVSGGSYGKRAGSTLYLVGKINEKLQGVSIKSLPQIITDVIAVKLLSLLLKNILPILCNLKYSFIWPIPINHELKLKLI